MQLFYCPGIVQGDDSLNREESFHCAKVLRKKMDDVIDITDGLGKFYSAKLVDLNHKKCSFKIISSELAKKPDNYIHIAIAPTKSSDRIEWFVEKAVEIGIDKISFVQSHYSERKSINLERIQKKAISAMKQSIRAYLPEIDSVKKLDTILKQATENQKFIAHLENDTTENLQTLAHSGQSYMTLIGPEGGFSDEELKAAKQHDFKVVKIGNYRLRTETAGVVACSILNQLNY